MSDIGILTTDTDLVVKSWDAALERMTGISADAARGRRLDELVPDLGSRRLVDLIREPLISGSAQVLAPALHKFLIPCPPLEPSQEFDRMQQRVVVGALRDEHRAVGLVMSIEDVTARLERERHLARQLRHQDPAVRVDAVHQLTPIEATDGLGPLGIAIGDDDWRVRRAAVRALAARRDAELVEAVVTALREGHRDFSLLSSALELLTVTGVDFTRALIQLLHDPDADLRIQAALALGIQRRPEAVRALVESLDDPDANVRFHAIEALGKHAPVAAMEQLTRIAESGDFFLAFPAIEALVRINDPIVAPRLAPLLADPLMAAAAADALGQIGDEDAVSPLVEALGGTAAPVLPAVSALASIHRRYETVFASGQEIEELVRSRISEAGVRRMLGVVSTAKGESVRDLVVVLGWIHEPSVPAALAKLLGQEKARHDVIEALVRFGSRAVGLLIEQLGAEDEETRRSAAIALGRIGDRRAVPTLIERLPKESGSLTVALVGALARLGDVRAFEPLLGLLGEGDAGVRQAAIGALNSIGHPEMSSRIAGMLEDANPLVRESAVKIAGILGYPDCLEAVLACGRDGDEAVQAAAIEHLPYFDDSRAVLAIEQALSSGSGRVRSAAAKALGSISGERGRDLLCDLLSDREPWVRYFSAISLRRAGDVRSVEKLAEIASADPADHVRIAAIESIGALGGAEAFRALERLVREGDDESRRTATRMLGRTKSPEVLELLRAALRSAVPANRLSAVEGLANLGGEGAIEPLQWTASADSDLDVMRAAFAGLGKIAGEDPASNGLATRAIMTTLLDPERRNEALATLACLGPSAIPVIAEGLSADDPAIRRSSVEALGRITHPSASACLRKALSDPDPQVRTHAIRALSRVGAQGLASRLSTIAENDPLPSVRQAAAAALSRQAGGHAGGE